MSNITKEELATMLEVVAADLMRWNLDAPAFKALNVFCMSAVWQLRGEPSFVERNDAMKARNAKHLYD